MLDEAKNTFIVGIKGVAMANIARILKKMGKNVTGSDTEEEQITDELLNKHNIPLITSFESTDLPDGIDLLIHSAAHGSAENPQVQEAKKRGIKVENLGEMQRDLMDLCKTKIAVCGSHGKTTVSALLSYALEKLGAKPSYLIGVPFFDGMEGGDFTSTEYFVTEADEYAVNPPTDMTPRFHFLNPDIILCTNIDFDHPDVFRDLAHAKEEFEKFFKKAKKVIMCPEEVTEKFETGLYGEKNQLNVAGVVEVLRYLGFEDDSIKNAIKDFKGPKRRFEQVAYENDIYLFDDYAHHPREIDAILQAARERFPDKRIIVLFQSHTYSRTAALLSEFGKSLAQADHALIAPIFSSARENPSDFKITHHNIAKAAEKDTVTAHDTDEEMLAKLKVILRRGDVIFTMGAGSIYKLSSDIIKIVKTI